MDEGKPPPVHYRRAGSAHKVLCADHFRIGRTCKATKVLREVTCVPCQSKLNRILPFRPAEWKRADVVAFPRA